MRSKKATLILTTADEMFLWLSQQLHNRTNEPTLPGRIIISECERNAMHVGEIPKDLLERLCDGYWNPHHRISDYELAIDYLETASDLGNMGGIRSGLEHYLQSFQDILELDGLVRLVLRNDCCFVTGCLVSGSGEIVVMLVPVQLVARPIIEFDPDAPLVVTADGVIDLGLP